MPHHTMKSRMSVEPSPLQVDYDVNITQLYEAICNCDWDLAVEYIRSNPSEARTWVVRHYQDDEGDAEEKEIMWRFLPIHSACARDPPAFVISSLLKAYPDGAHCVDDQGMYALHYACGNQASREVIRLLLVANSMAAKCADPRGMLPIHYLACWGPSSVSIIDMVMVANRDVGRASDNDGNTPLDLAMEGDYPERNAVVSVLKRWLEKSNRGGTPEKTTSRKTIEEEPTTTSAAIVPVEQPPKHTTQEEWQQEEEEEEEPVTPTSSFKEQQQQYEQTTNRTPLSVSTAVDDHQDDHFEVTVMSSSPLAQLQDHENATPTAMSTPRGAEEKGEAAAIPSPRTVSRLRQEVTKLRMEKHQSDAEWEEKLQSSVEVLDKKCDEMLLQVEELKRALEQANGKIVLLEQESTEKDQIVVDTESQLSDALERIQGMEQENQDLKQDITALEEENVAISKSRGNQNERLQSMTVALETMMERQDCITQSVNDKNAQLMEASQARRQNLKMLFDMEQEFMEAVMGDEEPEFEKQMKEMQALTATLEAMKD